MQMLCGSSVACAAPTISAVNKIKKRISLIFVVLVRFDGVEFRTNENVVQCYGFLTCFLV